jgi:hypothetical protein
MKYNNETHKIITNEEYELLQQINNTHKLITIKNYNNYYKYFKNYKFNKKTYSQFQHTDLNTKDNIIYCKIDTNNGINLYDSKKHNRYYINYTYILTSILNSLTYRQIDDFHNKYNFYEFTETINTTKNYLDKHNKSYKITKQYRLINNILSIINELQYKIHIRIQQPNDTNIYYKS